MAEGRESGDATVTGGYNHTFVDDVKEHECTFCLCVVREPILVVTCGHSFCTLCLDNWTVSKAQPFLCPVDNIHFTPNDMVKDLRLDRVIRNLKVYCENRDLGCTKTPELRDYEAHLESCAIEMSKQLRHENKQLLDSLSGIVTEVEDLRQKIAPSTVKFEFIESDVAKEIECYNSSVNGRLPKSSFPESYFKRRVSITKGAEKTIASEFYMVDGYKIRLYIEWGDDEEFKVTGNLVRGRNDINIQWPYKGEEIVIIRDVEKKVILGMCERRGVNSSAESRPLSDENEAEIFTFTGETETVNTDVDVTDATNDDENMENKRVLLDIIVTKGSRDPPVRGAIHQAFRQMTEPYKNDIMTMVYPFIRMYNDFTQYDYLTFLRNNIVTIVRILLFFILIGWFVGMSFQVFITMSLVCYVFMGVVFVFLV